MEKQPPHLFLFSEKTENESDKNMVKGWWFLFGWNENKTITHVAVVQALILSAKQNIGSSSYKRKIMPRRRSINARSLHNFLHGYGFSPKQKGRQNGSTPCVFMCGTRFAHSQYTRTHTSCASQSVEKKLHMGGIKYSSAPHRSLCCFCCWKEKR